MVAQHWTLSVTLWTLQQMDCWDPSRWLRPPLDRDVKYEEEEEDDVQHSGLDLTVRYNLELVQQGRRRTRSAEAEEQH